LGDDKYVPVVQIFAYFLFSNSLSEELRRMLNVSSKKLMDSRLVYHMKPGRKLMGKLSRKLISMRMRGKTVPNRKKQITRSMLKLLDKQLCNRCF